MMLLSCIPRIIPSKTVFTTTLALICNLLTRFPHLLIDFQPTKQETRLQIPELQGKMMQIVPCFMIRHHLMLLMTGSEAVNIGAGHELEIGDMKHDGKLNYIGSRVFKRSFYRTNYLFRITFEAEEDKSGVYAVLENIFADSENWEEAEDVRQTTRRCGAIKQPGYRVLLGGDLFVMDRILLGLHVQTPLPDQTPLPETASTPLSGIVDTSCNIPTMGTPITLNDYPRAVGNGTSWNLSGRPSPHMYKDNVVAEVIAALLGSMADEPSRGRMDNLETLKVKGKSDMNHRAASLGLRANNPGQGNIVYKMTPHQVVMEKDSGIYRGKKERSKSIALKAKKESSDDETSTFESDDEEYAMAVRNFKKFLEERVNLLGNQVKKRSHSDKGMRKKGRVTENALDAVIQIISLAIVQNQLATKIKRPSLEVLGAIAKMTPKTKIMMKLVSWLNRQMRDLLEKEVLELNEKIKKLERSKEIDIACLGFDSSKASTSGTKLMGFVGSSAEKATNGSTIKAHGFTIPGSVFLRTYLEPDEWIKDSGCSKHMTGNKSLFSTYKAYDRGTDSAKITRKRSKPDKHGHGNGYSAQEPEVSSKRSSKVNP
ncbi:hypothetical protein Tco_0936525, partial [Tanacetum coccineum]